MPQKRHLLIFALSLVILTATSFTFKVHESDYKSYDIPNFMGIKPIVIGTGWKTSSKPNSKNANGTSVCDLALVIPVSTHRGLPFVYHVSKANCPKPITERNIIAIILNLLSALAASATISLGGFYATKKLTAKRQSHTDLID